MEISVEQLIKGGNRHSSYKIERQLLEHIVVEDKSRKQKCILNIFYYFCLDKCIRISYNIYVLRIYIIAFIKDYYDNWLKVA